MSRNTLTSCTVTGLLSFPVPDPENKNGTEVFASVLFFCILPRAEEGQGYLRKCGRCGIRKYSTRESYKVTVIYVQRVRNHGQGTYPISNGDTVMLYDSNNNNNY